MTTENDGMEDVIGGITLEEANALGFTPEEEDEEDAIH